MTLQAMFIMNVMRANRWHNSINDWNALEWAGAMCGEAGEAANAAKKLKRVEDGLANINEEARSLTTLEAAKLEVMKECADTILYALLLMARVGCQNAHDVLADVFNKKSIEYGFPERFHKEKRNDEQ